LQKRFQKTFRHLLQTSVFVAPTPVGLLQVEFEFSALDRAMVSFADVDQANHGKSLAETAGTLVPMANLTGSGNGEAHGIPCAISWRPGTTCGIAKIAKRFKHILRRIFVRMSGSGATTAPSTSQRKP